MNVFLKKALIKYHRHILVYISLERKFYFRKLGCLKHLFWLKNDLCQVWAKSVNVYCVHIAVFGQKTLKNWITTSYQWALSQYAPKIYFWSIFDLCKYILPQAHSPNLKKNETYTLFMNLNKGKWSKM